MIKQLVIIVTAVMTTLLVLVVLWQFNIVVVYVLISLALAATVRPLVKGWTGRTILARLALILVYMACLGGFGLLIFFTGKFVINEIQGLGRALSVQNTWIMPPWLEGSPFQLALMARLPAPDQLLEAVTGETGQLVLPTVFGISLDIGGLVSGMLVILFLSIYWSINQIHFERLWLSLIPSGQRRQARGIWRTIELDIGAYIRSEIIQSLLAFVLLGVGYWLLGSPYPVLLALVSALAWLIPVVGAPMAIILPLLIGLMTSLQLSLFTVLITLVVLIAIQIWVEPRLYIRKWNNPILTLVILLALADAFGMVGILMAPPLSVVCQILWSRLVSNRFAAGASVKVSDLMERRTRLQTIIGEMEELPPPLVVSSMERLTELLNKAELVLPEDTPAEASGPIHSIRT